ncbi:MAG: RelA/SpoT family protein [Alphaproteobacteria bacterium]|nr:RelA/SpoT family protein [Alphaproteobacteria bacterium]
MISKSELVDIVASYTPNISAENKARIEKAYEFAQSVHHGQKRESGEAYFEHPLAVAITAASQYHMDVDSVITALLHDTIEDTGTSLEKISDTFGPTVAMLVKGLTKIHIDKKKLKKQIDAKNYANFIIAISGDIRSLILKIIDRYHNILTLDGKKRPESRQRIALETRNIFIPLAQRIGMHEILNAMEDRCFRELEPKEYAFIHGRLEELLKGHDKDKITSDIIAELTHNAFEHKLTAQITGRTKTPFSVWNKMVKKNKSFSDIFDLLAFRIITPTPNDCYKVLGMLHSCYKIVPNRFKDYISNPKPNGYRAIHTTVIGPMTKRTEIQIATPEMDDIAQFGYAAHWAYKQGKASKNPADFTWLKDILTEVSTNPGSPDLIEKTQLDAYLDSVFVFSRDNDLVQLPKGAIVLDFAYSVHSSLGNSCVGAKINGAIASIRRELKNGDEVEILTSKQQFPATDWEKWVKTNRAKTAIRKFLKEKDKPFLTNKGLQMLDIAYKKEGKAFNPNELDEEIIKHFKMNSKEELFIAVGSLEVIPHAVLCQQFPEIREKSSNSQKHTSFDYFIEEIKNRKKNQSISGSLANIPILFARCCHPLPSDKIRAIVHTGKGIAIHKATCASLDKADPARLMNISWEDCAFGPDMHFLTTMTVIVSNKIDALSKITSTLAKHDAPVSDIRIISKTIDLITVSLTLEISNIEQLNSIVSELKMTRIVHSVIKKD